MEQVKFLHLLIICVQTAKGFIWNPSTTSNSVCVGNTISLNWVYTLESGEILQITSWTKSDGAGGLITLGNDLGGFSPSYVGRLTNIGNAGIAISNATSSDIGTYTVIVELTSGRRHRMNATVHVHEIANPSCKPTCDSSWKCKIPQACPVQNYIDAVWTIDGVKHPNVVKCSPNNYNKPYSVCAEGDAVTLCYRGLSLCLKETPCIGTPCQSVLGFALGLSLCIQCVIICIVVVIFICTGYKYAYTRGLVLSLILGIIFIVCCIIIVSLIFTGTTTCKNELGLGLGLGSGMPCVITIIIAVIILFCSFSLFEGIPNIYEFGEGILEGFVIGIIVKRLKCTNDEDNPQGTDDKKSKTKNSGSPTVHTKSQNKVEPNTISEQTNYRKQPLPPVDTEFEDTPYRRLPQPPQNGEIKDRNLRGISATIDDTQGLANETPRNKLPPLTIEPKKKRKKRQKKDQMNEETPEEATILRVN